MAYLIVLRLLSSFYFTWSTESVCVFCLRLWHNNLVVRSVWHHWRWKQSTTNTTSETSHTFARSTIKFIQCAQNTNSWMGRQEENKNPNTSKSVAILECIIYYKLQYALGRRYDPISQKTKIYIIKIHFTNERSHEHTNVINMTLVRAKEKCAFGSIDTQYTHGFDHQP